MLPTGLSGDPLLKRLVDLAGLGWSTELALVSNGAVISGTLISQAEFLAALSGEILHREGQPEYEVLDQLVADAISTADPEPFGVPDDQQPEPRFIHLADVTVAGTAVPYLRLRLPAVSGFWLTSTKGGGAGATG
jgi:hypothetical protein